MRSSHVVGNSPRQLRLSLVTLTPPSLPRGSRHTCLWNVNAFRSPHRRWYEHQPRNDASGTERVLLVGIWGAAVAGPALELHLLYRPVLRTIFHPVCWPRVGRRVSVSLQCCRDVAWG
ncbi:hypothetical protein LX36DRAFT_660579 [Colletotrichum falcatum]|nr:hypothetical protein LX36DRAFT_660579 [Colletotrichum falcatum]